MNTIEIQNHKWNTASAWDELTENNILYFSRLVLKNFSVKEIKRRIGYRFSNIPARFYFKLNQIQRWSLEDTYNFLFESTTLTKTIPQSFGVGTQKYYGPGDEYLNVSVAEFSSAEAEYEKYLLTKSHQHLINMTACLYRTGSSENLPNGDFRDPFNSFLVKAQQEKFATLPKQIHYAVFLTFSGIRQLLRKEHPHTYAQKSEEKIKNYGWAGVIVDMAGPKYGTIEDVEKMNIWNVHFILEKNEVDRLRAETKK